MKNHALRFIALIIALAVLSYPVCTLAAEDESCSLTLTYSKGDTAFSDVLVEIYLVATLSSDKVFEKVSPFEDYPVKVSEVSSQTEWNEIAATLRGYVQADGISPYKTAVTDTEGKAFFENISEGLYLVTRVSAEKESVTCEFYDFMISIPAMDGEIPVYNVEAKPKPSSSDPSEDESEYSYTVLKLWKDTDDAKERPVSITVDILKDGELFETVSLSAENNWSYSFTNEAKSSSFSVTERNVPEGYSVKVSEKGTSFVLVNTYSEENPPSPGTSTPQTGDTIPLRLYVILSCAIGLLLLILGIGTRRKSNANGK